jgi:anti-sigma-K factor RskA
MTRDERSAGGRPMDEILAGEYVMGVLSIEARKTVERRMDDDEAFLRLVERWQSDMASFDDDYKEVEPRPAVYDQIEKRLFGARTAPARPSLLNSITFWRWLSGGLALGLVVSVIFAAGFVPSARNAGPLVAELSSPTSAVSLLASFNASDGTIRIVPVAAGRPKEKSLQLWLVPETGNPRPLGVLASGPDDELVIPADLRSVIGNGATLAVSLEPFGGSPTGLPTGPIVASGITRRL